MNLAFKIFFCSLIFCACANNTEVPQRPDSLPSAEPDVQSYIDSLEQTATGIADSTLPLIAESKPINSTPPKEKMVAVSEQSKSAAPRASSTIAQQQAAARKIQNELENRTPKPNEEKVQEGAVFNKIISTPKKKEKPKVTKVSEKKKPQPAVVKKKQSKGYPAIEFEELKMNFDTITEGDIIDYKFVFTNTGNAPLEIKSATPACGCTQPSFPFIPIEPNEKGHISVSYNSVGKDGNQNPEITILTNINKEEIFLVMEGFVIKKEPKKQEK